MKETEDGIVGTICDKEYLISQETVAAVSLCQNTGAVSSSNWKVAIGSDVVDRTIYGRLRGSDDEAGKFYRSSNLTPLCRILQNLFFNIFTPRSGGKDNVNVRDCFCLYHVKLRIPVNLPAVIMDH